MKARDILGARHHTRTEGVCATHWTSAVRARPSSFVLAVRRHPNTFHIFPPFKLCRLAGRTECFGIALVPAMFRVDRRQMLSPARMLGRQRERIAGHLLNLLRDAARPRANGWQPRAARQRFVCASLSLVFRSTKRSTVHYLRHNHDSDRRVALQESPEAFQEAFQTAHALNEPLEEDEESTPAARTLAVM